MTYTLIFLILSTGEFYVEDSNLSLEQCAGKAAMLRIEARGLEDHIGDFRYFCLPEDE